MSQKIYTKTGDEGFTSLIGGTKIFKSNLRIDSYGNIDELNSYIGLLADYITDKEIKAAIYQIQNHLFVIGSSLALDSSKELKMKLPELSENDVLLLENEIDKMNEELPELKHFILPGGHILVSCIHVARSVCRRAERSCVHLKEQGEFIEPVILKFLNRLSDYLFVLARFVGKDLGVAEIIWKGI